MPAAARKRSELFAKNIKHRGNVRKSLNPKTEQKIEAERLRKKGLGSGMPLPSFGNRRVIIAFLVLTLGSVLYQICMPFFGGDGSSSGRGSSRSAASQAKQSNSVLTREQQARAAEAVLQELNRKATEKYFSMAKDYKPPPKNFDANADANDDDGFIDFEEAARKFVLENDGEESPAVAEAQGPLV
ncbi:hypothetical protein GGI15_004436 [Coemansia interrupta]|uniref:Uncharacterized protein n=1 Tax=Coemansia interrupta TaxID=1126814 RepID=A0A9W8LDY8_9FUNG|nr:hypothetical protein GGI15_004436 [Coemansia interrupta]